ncbi:efflux RND transporter periplasmic adaptor subunit [Flavisolibacter tropicus]|uniref:CzcB-like barrel-sandwich hybrid domain-containing protein n=1 Tax=Flavisolibacter tropicus TaxID=1492898 RepID=A0A172TVR7_9BACT|nr:efflux RND transporter periplasmic adaptor subunit [Flavisolibacter tropicus]ANE50883.1 hypothetical protein SY85_10580 [Flavisolibacter tropicus]
MKRIFIFIAIISSFASCSNKSTANVDAKGEITQEAGLEESHNESEGTTVSLTEVQMQTAAIELGTIELKNLKTSIKANGNLTVPNQNKALVTSINSGVLKTLLIQPGNYVRQGQVIATIVNPDAARLQQELQTTNAQLNLAQIELNRQKELVEGNAAPLKNVQRVQTEIVTLRATRNALQKQLSAMGISVASVSKGNIVTTIAITAPISGTVSTVSAQIGSPVDASSPIAEIVNNSQLHLDLFVYEKDLHKLHAGQTIHFTLTNGPGKEYDARIYSIGTAFVGETKTIPIHAVVMGNKEGLIEGMNITALISIGTAVVPAVPSDAIVSYQGQDYLFVLTSKKQAAHSGESKEEGGKKNAEKDEAGMSFERVQVIKGISDIGYTEVTLIKDLPPHSKIITKGAFFANAKMTNTGEHED